MRAQEGDGPAALALGLAAYVAARPILQQLAATRTRGAPSAQHALLLLDDSGAADELLPALSQVAEDKVLELYARVRCPAAIPWLLGYVNNEAGHRALAFQARVDFGSDQAAWKEWYQDFLARVGHPTAALHRADLTSQLLWQGALQQLTPTILGNQLRLHTSIAMGMEFDGTQILRRGKVIRTKGAAYGPVLEWSLSTGQPLRSLPRGIPPGSQFIWNSPRQLLLCEKSGCYWVYLRGKKVWSSVIPGALDEGERGIYRDTIPLPQVNGHLPECFKPSLRQVEFTDDEQELAFNDTKRQLRLRMDASGNVLHRTTYPLPGPMQSVRRFSTDHTSALIAEDWNRNDVTLLPEGVHLADAQGADLAPDGTTVSLADPLRLHVHHSPDRRGAEVRGLETRFDPSGHRLAVSTQDELLILDTATLHIQCRTPFPGARHLTWDESGRFLSAHIYGTLRVYDTAPDRQEVTRAPDQRLLSEVWSGFRLLAGTAVPLTPEEFQERSTRLRHQLGVATHHDPILWLSTVAWLLCLTTWVALRRAPRLPAQL